MRWFPHLCKALNCAPGDLIEYIPDEHDNS
ncbi:MAG: helix-turn-helix domain-containing protein [Planctomycetota bacterium]